ncbi:hypothetical protein D3C85_858790 [compost metagenome]
MKEYCKFESALDILVEYSISEYGKGLSTVLQALNDWGVTHIAHMDALYKKNLHLTLRHLLY